MRYAGRVLPHDRPIVISLDPAYARGFSGQVAEIVAAKLIRADDAQSGVSRPERRKSARPLPWAGRGLADFMLSIARAADPYAEFSVRVLTDDDYVLALGRGPSPACVHGSGRDAFMVWEPRRSRTSPMQIP